MPDVETLITPDGRRIAYSRTDGAAPGILFLGGFRSNMEGAKALFLEERAREAGRAFVRFDYSGHGASGGLFEEGAIGDWAADARAVLEGLTAGPQILVGSSMGGWIALILARTVADRVAGIVGVAAAPDFTEDSIWANATPAQRETLMRAGQIDLPSDYSDAPYVITRRLVEDGRQHLVLRDPLELAMPLHLLQGSADTDVPVDVAQRLFDHVTAPDVRLTIVKGADHRFSSPACLDLIWSTILNPSPGRP
jgi:pimeloyl-ACP methyl ester carboxylesterase